MTAWNADTEADIGGTDAVTLVEGSSFCISAHSGDISSEGGTNGAFYQDTRIVSRWILRINGALREPLVAHRPDAYEATFVGRAKWPDARFDSPLVVRQDRHIGPGLQDDITLENYSSEPVECEIELLVDADQAADTERGWVTTAVAGLPLLPIKAKPRRVYGVSATSGRRGMAIVATTAATLWTGAATTFTVEGNDNTNDTMTVTRRVGESFAQAH